MTWQRVHFKIGDFGKMAYLAKMTEMAIILPNRHIVNKNSNEMAKGPF